MRPSLIPDFLRRLGPPLRPWLRRAGWAAFVVYFAFALLVLVLRYAILPRIEDYRADIEGALTRSLQLPVSIRTIDAGWAGLRPRLAIHGLDIRDAAGRPAIGFDNVEAELSWSSLWHFGLRLQRLEVTAPEVDVRRDAAGRLSIAGIEIAAGGPSGFPEWLLAQERIVVSGAAIRWHDELRAAPPLILRRLNLDLQNDGNRHRFGLKAEPPPELAARLDVRGDFRGADLDQFEAWKGDLYAELDYADLAVWRTWIDYPLELPQGSGGLRLWLSFARQQPTAFTADVRLADVRVRAAASLPMLDLSRLEGRFAARRLPGGFEVETRHLALATRDGLVMAPTDARLRYVEGKPNRPAAGEFEASGLELGAVATLAAHLPLPEAAQNRIAALAPSGRLPTMKITWSGEPGALKNWRAKGGFENLKLAADGAQPGFAGFSGSIDGDDKGGRLVLDSRQAALELPGLFAEPHLELDALAAQATWKNGLEGLDITLAQASFRNRDAAGEASGRYRRTPEGGPGEIDLTARLTRGAGDAVWRYMPLAVGAQVRDWLHTAILGGQSSETSLRLKGNLAKFPFRGGKGGLFQVKGRFQNATLRYAQGWPEIRNIEGDLLFEGEKMLIQGRKGNIFGVGIGPVSAEIADLEAHEELLVIDGRAAGVTADFLRFIEASPVGERIDHFTADMTAAGSGELKLRLDLPLRRLADTKVDGRYRFVGNQLTPDPDMPPLTEVNGEIHFTGDRLEGQKIRAAMLGMPLTVDIATADGNVGVKAAGTLAARALYQQFGHPLFEHLSGVAPWTGSIKIRKKNPEIRIESSLQGIASSLPEPFNKSASEALPLVVERKLGPGAGRDTVTASLGEALRVSLARRRDGDKTVIERGAIAIGTAPRLPERGVLLAVQAKRIDIDAWRRLAGDGKNGQAGAALPISQVDLRADELVAFGRAFAGLRLAASQSGGVWKADLRGREATGSLEWDGRGAGRIGGHLTQLTIPESAGGKGAPTAETPEELPAVDLVVDHFAYHGRDFGAVKLKAANAGDGYWNASFDVRNDESSVEGTGRWRPSTVAPDTRMEFKVATRSIEKLLLRQGYPDAVRRGTASLDGTLSWKGSPFGIDYPSLEGNLKFEAANGQFNKLEPGVGRLLGVLSLQSLPRRLTLDFRDVFSEGFAFDGIAGQATVKRGIMETQGLKIAGPSARVEMTGSVNLVAETQNLRVRVQPAIGESVVTGVLLAHPATGAAAWVFNKLFGNPLDRAFSFEYAVTGPWSDPKVEKLGEPGKATGADKP